LAARYETLLVQQKNHVLLVTLNRPEAGNALNLAMLTELNGLLSELHVDAGPTRCVVLTGAGERIFCGGGDMKERRTMTPDAARRQRVLMEQLIRNLQESDLPIIAAVNGAAVGGGCEIVAAVDFAYGAEMARFSLPEVKLGIVPGGGATQTMPRACGLRRAKELILTGILFSATEALRWGLLNKLLPAATLLPVTLEVAHLIANNAPLAVKEARKAVSMAFDMDMSTGLRFELVGHYRTAATKDRAEALNAYAEKRAPIFRGE
jgi:enoyl-CoA hydratase/carnithine racemase